MSNVAADRTCVHGAGRIDMPPGSARREEGNAGESNDKCREAQRPHEACPAHSLRSIIFKIEASCDTLLEELICAPDLERVHGDSGC